MARPPVTGKGRGSTPLLEPDVLAFSGAFLPGFKAGGPIRSMVDTLEVLPPRIRVLLVTRDRDMADTEPYPDLSGTLVPYAQHAVYYLNTRSIPQWLSLLRLYRKTRPHLLYVNSLWSPLFGVVPLFLRIIRIIQTEEVLLAPRGELADGALGIKPQKKWIFMKLWRPVLDSVDPVFQASTERERSDILRAFPSARTIVHINRRGPEPFDNVVPSSDPPRFVFISRISPSKNLKCALKSLMHVTTRAILDIYGPVEDAHYWAECASLIDGLPPNITVTYRGMLEPGQVRAVFADYDAFVFPTLGENFGHAILESLSAGCPVLCSDRTLWNETLRLGGGEVLDTFEPMYWARAIQTRAEMSAGERTELKRAALAAYAQWQLSQPTGSGVELVLAGRAPARGPSGRRKLSSSGSSPP